MDDGGGSARRLPWVTITLAVANVAVFIWQLVAGASIGMPTPDWMLDHGGNFGPVTLDGEQWRLFTSMFLHYGALHIAMNLIGLIDGGRHVERMYGAAGFAALYLTSGLAGSLASALRGGAISAGASGAVFGIFGAFGAFLLLHRERLDPARVSREGRGLLVFLAYNMIFGFTTPGIDMAAHIGGLLAGFAVGLALEVGTGEDPSTVRRSLLVAVVGVALVAGGALLAPKPENVDQAYQDLGTTETTVLDRYNQAIVQFQTDAMSDTQLADVIEKELLPPWRDMQARFRRDGKGEMRQPVIDYLAAREEGWDLMLRGLRARDRAQFDKGMARLKEGEAVLERMKKD